MLSAWCDETLSIIPKAMLIVIAGLLAFVYLVNAAQPRTTHTPTRTYVAQVAGSQGSWSTTKSSTR